MRNDGSFILQFQDPTRTRSSGNADGTGMKTSTVTRQNREHGDSDYHDGVTLTRSNMENIDPTERGTKSLPATILAYQERPINSRPCESTQLKTTTKTSTRESGDQDRASIVTKKTSTLTEQREERDNDQANNGHYILPRW